MTRNEMNARAYDDVATTNNNNLFTSYINSDVAAEQASYSLREAIVTTVINNTAIKTRVDHEFFNQLISEAEIFVGKKEIKLYKDDRYICTYTFFGNPQQILAEIEKFFINVIIEYNCFYGDRISYDEREGFCWEYDGMKIAIV